MITTDFSDAAVIELNINGWIPIEVEYVYGSVSGATSLNWRVKGTEHVFKVDLALIYKHHGTNISEHFELALTCFREDYLNWTINHDERAEPYHKQFGHLIVL